MRSISIRALFGASLFGFCLTGCLQEDPNHCSNRGGSPACETAGLGDYCSLCVASNFGCREIPDPDMDCWVDEPDAGANEDDDVPDDVPDSDSDAEPQAACAASGPDATCPASAPYCFDGVCGGCAAGGPGMCAGLDPMAPLCSASWDVCVGCEADADCGGVTPTCDTSSAMCRGCTTHDECPDSACNAVDEVCLDADRVLWVDPSVCPHAGFGTDDDPYCEIEDALDQLRSGDTLMLMGGGPSFAIDHPLPKTVAIRGVNRPRVTFVRRPGPVVSDGSLFMDGLQVMGGDGPSLTCSRGSLWLDDCRLEGGNKAIEAWDCDLIVRRSVVTGVRDKGVLLEAGSLRLESSVIAGNGGPDLDARAVTLIGATATISFSTIAGNSAANEDAPVSLHCDDSSTASIRNSVLLASALNSIACSSAVIDHSVIDTVGIAGTRQTVVEDYDPSWWANIDAGDAHVEPHLGSALPGAARWGPGDPVFDIDGTARHATPGATDYAGADRP